MIVYLLKLWLSKIRQGFLVVEKEFIPKLNEEHSGYAWCTFDAFTNPLHQGVRNSFNNRAIRAKLELLLDLI